MLRELPVRDPVLARARRQRVCRRHRERGLRLLLPAADARDEDMRRRNDEWDEGTLKAQFEEIAEIFLYDAYDAAAEWWVNWGRFSDMARDQPPAFDFESVTVSQTDDY